MRRLLLYSALLTSTFASAVSTAAAQATVTSADLQMLMRDVCRNEMQMLQRHDSRLRYQVHRTDHKGTTLRDQVESHDGGVARLLQHDGRPLTPDEDEGERKRLQALLGSSKLQQREREEIKNREYGMEVLQVLPEAMRFTLAPQQNPVPDTADKQIVIDFNPNPEFHPASMAQQILPALHGRMWIDVPDHQLLRMELGNTSDVNLAWGLLAKVYAGSSITYEQRRFEDLYTFTHIVMHLRVRELMLKTVSLDTETTAAGFQRLASSPSSDEAVKILLADPVPTR